MDIDSVCESTDQQLRQLGLTATGDLIALRTFCLKEMNKREGEKNNNERKKTLTNFVRNNGRLSSKDNDSGKTRRVQIGWMHYNMKKGKYCSVRIQTGGGTREVKMALSTTADAILTMAKELFFPAGRSTVGNMNDMEFKLANFKQEELSETVELGGSEVNFTLGNYIEKYKLTRIRIYLQTRERNKFRELLGKLQTKRQSVRQEEQQPPVVVVKDGESDSSFDDDRHEKALPLEIPDEERITDEEAMPSFLVGTSEERRRLKAEIDQAYEESPAADQRKEEEKKSNELAKLQEREREEDLRAKRAARVCPEPSLDSPHVVVSVRHCDIGLIRRIFSESASMLSIYDWIGSLQTHPMYFKLCKSPSVHLKPDESVKVVDRVLLMEASNEPIYLDDEKEVGIPGFACSQDEQVNDSYPEAGDLTAPHHQDDMTEANFDKLQEKRLMEHERLYFDAIPIPVFVERSNVVKDIYNMYNSEQILSRIPVFNFVNENATGNGVTIDVFSEFFHAFFSTKFDGIEQCVPSISSNTDYIVFGKIISHAFFSYGIFPIQFCKASLKHMLFGNVNEEDLLESFMKFLQLNEQSLLTKAMTCYSEDVSKLKNEVIGLSDYNIQNIPRTDNILSLVIQAAKHALVRAPQFSMLEVRQGMGEFWHNVTEPEIDALYISCIPTPEKVLKCLNVEPLSKKEETVVTYLQRFIRSSSQETLERFLQYCTGASMLLPGGGITIHFVNQISDIACRPVSKTCFKILELARQYENFRRFKQTMEFYLRATQHWEMQD